YSPFQAGLWMLPFGILVIGTPSVAVRLVARFGPRPVAVASPAIAVAGLVWMSLWNAHGSVLVQMVLPMLVLGLGMSICFFSMIVLVTSAVPDQHSGLGSGLLNAGRQVGGSVGLAALSVVAAAHTRAIAGPHHAAGAQAVTSGYGLGLPAGAAAAARRPKPCR